MAPVPKKKHSKGRTGRRRGSKVFQIPTHLWGVAGLGKRKVKEAKKAEPKPTKKKKAVKKSVKK